MKIKIRDITGFNFKDPEGHDLNDTNISLDDFYPFDGEYAEVTVCAHLKSDDPVEAFESFRQAKIKGGEYDGPIICYGLMKTEKTPDGGIVFLTPAE